MNNLQLYLTIGIPTITVILAWLSNRSDSHRTNDKIDRLAENLRSEMATMRSEMISIRADHHRDNGALIGYMIPLHERMAKLESRG